jgi:hypothetical protein
MMFDGSKDKNWLGILKAGGLIFEDFLTNGGFTCDASIAVRDSVLSRGRG